MNEFGKYVLTQAHENNWETQLLFGQSSNRNNASLYNVSTNKYSDLKYLGIFYGLNWIHIEKILVLLLLNTATQ